MGLVCIETSVKPSEDDIITSLLVALRTTSWVVAAPWVGLPAAMPV